MLVEQREVEVELAREVLVEHRFGDPGPVGDLVHGGGVVAGLDEHRLGGVEQLGAALAARHPLSAGGRVRAGHACPSAGDRSASYGRVTLRGRGRATPRLLWSRHGTTPAGAARPGAHRRRSARGTPVTCCCPTSAADGQRRLRAARVLVVGAGGLGSPALLYLAAAGVGTIGRGRRRRRRHHQPPAPGGARGRRRRARQDRVGRRRRARHQPDHARSCSTPSGSTRPPRSRSSPTTTSCSTAPTTSRPATSSATPAPGSGVPHVWGSVYRFDGQVSVWWAGEGPCYACVFPHQPPPDAVPSCAVGGVLGAVCASIGSVMATEAVKLVTGIGEPLVGRLLVHDALRQTWDALPVTADPGCRVCGSGADATRPLGWATGIPADAGRGRGCRGRRRWRRVARPTVDVVGLSALLDAGELDGEQGLLLDVREAGRARRSWRFPAAPGCPSATCAPVRAVPGLAPGRSGLRLLQVRRALGRGGRPAAGPRGRRGRRRGRHPRLGRAGRPAPCRPTDPRPRIDQEVTRGTGRPPAATSTKGHSTGRGALPMSGRRGGITGCSSFVVPLPVAASAPVLDASQQAVVEHRGPVLRVLGAPGTGPVHRRRRGGRPAGRGAARRAPTSASCSPPPGSPPPGCATRSPPGSAARRPRRWRAPTSRLGFGILREAAALAGDPAPRLLSGPEQDVILGELLAGHAAGESTPPPWPESVHLALPTRTFRGELRDLLMRAVELGPRPRRPRRPRPRARPPRVGRRGPRAARVRRGHGPVGAGRLRPGLDPRRGGRPPRDRPRGPRTGCAPGCGSSSSTTPRSSRPPRSGSCGGRRPAGGVDLVLLGDPDAATQTFRGADPRLFVAAWPDAAHPCSSPRPTGAVAACSPRPVAWSPATSGWSVAPRTARSPHRPRGGAVEAHLLRTAAQEAGYVAGRLRAAHLLDGVPWSRMAVVVRGGGRTATLRRVLRGAGVPVDTATADLPVRDEAAVRPFLTLLRCALEVVRGGRAARPGRRRRRAHLAGRRCRCRAAAPAAALAAAPRARRRRWPAERRAARRGGARSRSRSTASGPRRPRRGGPPGARGRGRRPARRRGCRGRALADVERQRARRAVARRGPGRRPGGRPGRPRPRRRAGPLRRRRPLRRPAARRLAPPTSSTTCSARTSPATPSSPGRRRASRSPCVTPAASAGREWDVVVVAGVQEGVWPDLRLRGSLLGSTDLVDLVTGRAGDPRAARAQVRHDETRLFHVAVTRARRRLVVTAVRSEDEQPSPFLDVVDPLPHARPFTDVAAPADPARAGRRAAPRGRRPRPRRPAVRRSPPWPRSPPQGVPGADPAQWWALRDVSDDRPRRAPGASVSVSPSTIDHFGRCRLQWVLRAAGGDGPSMGAQDVGTLVHEVAHDLGDTDAATYAAALEARWGRLGLAPGWLSRRDLAPGHGDDRPARPLRRRVRRRGVAQGGVARCASGWRSAVPSSGARSTGSRSTPDGRVRVVDLKTGPRQADRRRGAPARPARGLPARRRGRGPSPSTATASGGAALLQLGRAADAERRRLQVQRPLATDDDPTWARDLVDEVAEGMAGAVFSATPGAQCGTCQVKDSCPAYAGGEAAVTGDGTASGTARPATQRPRACAGARSSWPARSASRTRRPPSRSRSSRPRCARCSSSPGAGSGKTETMAARVVWLVANDLVRPDEVLGLTFTRKAAGELSERLRPGWPPCARRACGRPRSDDGAAVLDDVPTVSTYHAYAGRIVREHGLRLGVEAESRLLSEAAAWQVADEVVASWDGPMDGVEKAESTVTTAVVDLAGEMAEHLVGVDDVARHLDEVVAALEAVPSGGHQAAHLPRRGPRGRHRAARAAGGAAAGRALPRAQAQPRRHGLRRPGGPRRPDRHHRAGGGRGRAGAVPGRAARRVPGHLRGPAGAAALAVRGAGRAGAGHGRGRPAPVDLRVARGQLDHPAPLPRGLRRPRPAAGAAAVDELAQRPGGARRRQPGGRPARPARPGCRSPRCRRAPRRAAGTSPRRASTTIEDEAAHVAAWVAAPSLPAGSPHRGGAVPQAFPVRPGGRGARGARHPVRGRRARRAAAHARGGRPRRPALGRAGPHPWRPADAPAHRAVVPARRGRPRRPRRLGPRPAAHRAAPGRRPRARRERAGRASSRRSTTSRPPTWVGDEGQSIGPVALERLAGSAAAVRRLRSLTGLGLAELAAEAEVALGLDIEVLARPGLDARRGAGAPRRLRRRRRHLRRVRRPGLARRLPRLARRRRRRGARARPRLDRGPHRRRAGADRARRQGPGVGRRGRARAGRGVLPGPLGHPHLARATARWAHPAPTDKGWLAGLATLPYDLRGDAEGLPRFAWSGAPRLGRPRRRSTSASARRWPTTASSRSAGWPTSRSPGPAPTCC